MFSRWHMIMALWPCRRCSCRRLKICKVCKVINLIAGATVSHSEFFYLASPKTYLQQVKSDPPLLKTKPGPSSKQVLAQDFLSPASKELALHFWKVESHPRQMNSWHNMSATPHPKAWPLLLVWSEVPVEGGGACNDLLGLCFLPAGRSEHDFDGQDQIASGTIVGWMEQQSSWTPTCAALCSYGTNPPP